MSFYLRNKKEISIIFWGGVVWADFQNLLVVWVLEKGDGDQTESRGGVVFGEESAGEGGEAVVDVLDKGQSILGWPFWRDFLSTVGA